MLSRCSTKCSVVGTIKTQAIRGCRLLSPTYTCVLEEYVCHLQPFPVHHREYNSDARSFQTLSMQRTNSKGVRLAGDPDIPGSAAFADCEMAAVKDLFFQFATNSPKGHTYLDLEGVREILASIGERPDRETLNKLFRTADTNENGTIEMNVSSSFCRRF